MTYNSGIKAKNDYYGTIAFAKETAKLEGLEEGEINGRFEERTSFISGMKNEGFSSEQIAKVAKLTVEEINLITA